MLSRSLLSYWALGRLQQVGTAHFPQCDYYEKSIKWGDELTRSAEGVWLIPIPTPMGNILMLHTNHAHDLSGTRYGGTMWEVNGNPTHSACSWNCRSEQ